MPNAYATDRNMDALATPAYADQDTGDYSVPDPLRSNAPYTNGQGWSPSYRISPDNFPDATRLGTIPLEQYDEDAHQASDASSFYHSRDADKAERSSVEYQDADGWTENKAFPGYPLAAAGANRWARNPRETPPPEPRPTTSMAPRTYTFLRPFMTGQHKMGSRHLNGLHFSMAAHRRTYDVTGTTPVRNLRNTYRLDPAPWDSGIVDMPPANARTVADMQEVPPTVEVGYQSRSWRLV